jgi:hypothetical protein
MQPVVYRVDNSVDNSGVIHRGVDNFSKCGKLFFFCGKLSVVFHTYPRVIHRVVDNFLKMWISFK